MATDHRSGRRARPSRCPAGTSLLDAAILCELDVPAPCGGQGRCGRCRVRIVSRGRASGAATPASPPPRSPTAGRWPARRSCRAPPRSRCPSGAREKVRPHGHAVAEPESLPIACDWRQNPAVRTFELDIEPPSLVDNTSDFDRLRRALAQQHGIEEIRAELPMLRRLGKDLRMANWKVSVTLEMRDWVYGAYLPPRLIRIYPGAFSHAQHGRRRSTSARRPSWSTCVDFATGRVVDTRQRLQQADRLRRRRDLAHHLRQAQARPGPPAAPRRGDHQRPRSTSCRRATASSSTRSTRSPSPATRR